MKLLRRRERVPDEVRAAVPLLPGERILSVCLSGEVGYLVASDHALYRVELPAVERLRWDLIDRAAWDPPTFDIRIRDSDGEGSGTQRRVWPADQNGDLPAVVRDRVTGSILTNAAITVPGGRARIVARRNADTGEVRWQVEFGPGVDPADPAVAQAAERELTDLRSRLGV